MKHVSRPEMLIPVDRLPVELQDGLGFRFLSQIPRGPMRDSVEGYLAIPPTKRGAGTFAYKIVVAAVRAEQERKRSTRGSVGRFMDMAESGATAAVEPAAPVATKPFDAVPPSGSNHSDGRVRFEFEDPTGPGAIAEVTIPVGRTDRPTPDSPPVTWRKPGSEPEPEPEPPPIAAEPPPFPSANGASIRSADVRRAVSDTPVAWPTGFDELDAWGLRWIPGELHLVHGPPGGGRTAFLLELLRRYADGRGGAVYVSGRESREELYVRLLAREVAQQASRIPITGALIHAWLRDPTCVHHTQADALAGAAQRLDDLVARGGLVLAEGPGDGRGFGDWAGALVDRAATEGPALVIVDDAVHAPASRQGDPSSPSLFRTIRRMRRIALGRGPESRVPVIFSVPFPPSASGGTRLGTVLRVDGMPDGAAIRISVDRNAGGARGGSVELAMPGGAAEG